MAHITEDEVREYAKSKNPDAAAIVDNINYGLWTKEQVEQSVKDDVLKLRTHPTLTGLKAYGFILETETRALREVKEFKTYMEVVVLLSFT